MRPAIKDEFAALPISRQRKWQLRKAKAGRCERCGAPAGFGTQCLKHLILARERQRMKHRLQGRYKNALSYKLEKWKRKPRGAPMRTRALLRNQPLC
jgi:hypothetical protein